MAPPPRSHQALGQSSHTKQTILELTNNDSGSATKIHYARFVSSNGTAGECEQARSKDHALGISIERTQPGAVDAAPVGEFDGYEDGDTVRVLIFSTKPVTVEASPTTTSVVEGDLIASDDHGKARAFNTAVSDDVPLLRAIDLFEQDGLTWIQGYMSTFVGGEL